MGEIDFSIDTINENLDRQRKGVWCMIILACSTAGVGIILLFGALAG